MFDKREFDTPIVTQHFEDDHAFTLYANNKATVSVDGETADYTYYEYDPENFHNWCHAWLELR